MKKLTLCIAAVLLLCLLISGCDIKEQLRATIPGIYSLFEKNSPETPQIEPAAPPQVPSLPDSSDNAGANGEETAQGAGEIPAGEISAGGFRGVWVATVLNLDFPSRQDLSAAAMKREIDAIVARTAELGLNAIIFQVRPTGDSFFESDIFPWSRWLSGTQGRGVPDFDPLEYWIETCHANDIELHAWLNPFRIIHTSTNSSDPNTLAPDHPVRLRPDLAVGWSTSGGNAGLFLDPGLPEARQLIIDGIAEIVTKYDVDGIHIDDYFYPGTNFNDAASYSRYGNGMDLSDWRRENVNKLIKDVQAVIRELNAELDKNVRWGISPTAIWKNGANDPNGVPTTRGQESYHAMYADTRRWVMEEWVDYICPQIYWYIGFETAGFEPILNWWIDLCKDCGVDLYVGHAAYREDQNDQPPRWRGEMVRQLEMAAGSDVVKGSAFYRFLSLRGAVGAAIRDFYSGEVSSPPPRQPVMILDTLTVGLPFENVTITATASAAPGYTIAGASDPNTPLYMNGAEVTNRTVEGFFSVYAPLETGTNVFTFSQEGQEDVTRKITRKTPAPSTATPAPAPEISEITAPRYATIASDAAWVYPGNSATGGSDWMMTRGQTDRVIAESGNGFIKLSCGMWISRDLVTIRDERGFTEDVLLDGVYQTGTDYDVIVWRSDEYPAVYAGFDGRVLTVSFGMHTKAPPLALPKDLSKTIFAGVESGERDGIPFYAFRIRDGERLEGHYIDYENGEFRLHLKKRKTLTDGGAPLSGITIVLDPGHGGEAYGAIGPLGRELPEKELTLTNTLKLTERLTALGATVHLTRDADTEPSVQERVDLSLLARPDLFISLHVNSVAETTNASNIRGFTVWYRNPGSISLARTILDVMYDINPETNRNHNINQANLFVCRPQWAPSVILEASFIINLDDFVWLIDPAEQDKMADATVAAILEYFSP